MNRKGFTLIELLIVVVIIGILAALAIPNFATTKQRAILASMKTDLRNLATAQESFYFENSDYAGGFTAGVGVPGTGGAGQVHFLPSPGNSLVITYVGVTGYKATITNPLLTSGTSTCGIYMGPGNSPNAAVTSEGAPGCW
jgi:type IV pilus assembly protein PilA